MKGISERQFPHLGGNALDADAITFLSCALHVCQNWLQTESRWFPVAKHGQLNWFVFGLLESLNHCGNGWNWFAIEGDDYVSLFHADLLRRHARLKIGHGIGLVGNPSHISHLRRASSFGHDRSFKLLVATLEGNLQRLIGIEHHFGIDLFPSGILYAVDSDDAIAHL